MTKPVLHAIRALLKFRDDASISEIAKMAGVSQRRVLDVVNANGSMVWRNRKTGRITRVDPIGAMREAEWKSGKYYSRDTYGAWAAEGHCLRFNGHDDLRTLLTKGIWTGGLGDSWKEKIVPDTPENRATLEAAGLRPWSEAVIDDRFWQECDAELKP